MTLIFHTVLLYLHVTAINSSIDTNLKRDVLSFLKGSDERDTLKSKYPYIHKNRYINKQQNDRIDAIAAKSKAKVFKKAKKVKENENYQNDVVPKNIGGSKIGKEYYHMDPVLNILRRTPNELRRKGYSSSSAVSSSSKELKDWKDEWREYWIQKKFDAINSSAPRGDVVNMVAARPWGVSCGDPNQHDMPWGTCMLPMECEAEYRIYRGDYFCGRTQFICCSLRLTTYDMYQGFDISFDASSLSTDSEEKKNRGRGSKEKRKRKKQRERRKRRRNRLKRKRQIKKNIKRIIKEMRKILNKSYRNGTRERKRKTKQLKAFVKELKKQYRKDRQAVKAIHEHELIKIDNALQKKLKQIKGLNQDFIGNSTFRNIVVNGTLDKAKARMLVQTYPELLNFTDGRRRGKRKDYLDYDIEYGMVYT